MFPAQLPKNGNTENKNTNKTKKNKFNNHTEEKKERLFTFKRFYFLNCPPGGTVGPF